jgi:branched-subunit amino acid aminotransferase/4-amino-4-deoxychorismate lyase
MITSLIDGHREDSISVYDEGLLRGDGCFEAIRSYDGVAFAFADHYKRLARSAAALDILCPPEESLRAWVDELAQEGGECIVRVVLTRGSGASSRCVVLWQPLPAPAGAIRLLPVEAPWHPGGHHWELSGVKTISYAPNMAASRLAQSEDFDDALLISREGFVLEGPTFSVAWFRAGLIETPGLDLGILDSVTSRQLLTAAAAEGMAIVTGRFRLDALAEASEVVALSTVKEVSPVIAVGENNFVPGAPTESLAHLYRRLVKNEQKQRVRT